MKKVSIAISKDSIKINQSELEKIVQQVKDSYPKEAGGLLLGERREISKVVPLENRYPTPKKGCTMNIQDIYNIVKESGKKLVGIYHSHPDVPDLCFFSLKDLKLAEEWPIYTLIMMTRKRKQKWAIKPFLWRYGKKKHSVELYKLETY